MSFHKPKKYANYIYWHWFTAKWWSSKSQRSKRKTQPQSPNFSMDVTSAKHLSNLYIVGSKIINKIDKIYPAMAWSPSDWIITILSQSQGCPVRIPATSYLVPLFTLIYLVLFHLLLPSYLDVPCYLNNRQRYCSVWPEREDSLHSKCENCVIEQMCLWLHWTLFVLLSIILPPLVPEVIIWACGCI